MIEIPIGEVIRERRKELKLTQKALSEGICEPMTLSRIENGKQFLTYNRTKALLQRLGLPDDRYTARLNPNEVELQNRRAEVKACVIAFCDAAAEDKLRRREDALNVLSALSKIAEPDDNLTQQYIVGVKVTLGREDGPYTLEEKLELLLGAIRLTVPQFDLDRIKQFQYSQGEFEVINKIAVAYAKADERGKAIHIYQQLFDYVQQHKQNVNSCARDLGLIACNYSRELMINGDYSKAVEVAEQGRQICVKYGKYQSLGGILAVLANCYAHLRMDMESKEMYYDAYHLFRVLGQTVNIAHLRNDARDTLCLELS